jgi:thiamine biosynthesis lipoprotein
MQAATFNAIWRWPIYPAMKPLKILALFLPLLLFPLMAGADWLRGEAAIMGTAIHVELWHEDPVPGRALIDDVMDEMRRIDKLMSSYKPDSELSQVNASAAAGPIMVSNELLTMIGQALKYSGMTDGAFDITYASAGQFYDYRTRRKPDSQQLSEALPAIDYRHVRLDTVGSTVQFLRPGVRIDLGGIAKGYAIDRSIAILQAAGVRNALVSAGGDTRVIGRHWEHPWKVGIRDPRNRDGIVSIIPLEDAAISTSGDYERYFEENGKRYHHILNPGTGDSPREVHSTSIIGSNATDTDALSTSVFVMGVDKGLNLVNSLPDTEAIIIDDQGKMHYSDGLARLAP